MEKQVVYTKTAKGLTEAIGKTKELSRGLRDILKQIDGRANLAELQAGLGNLSDKKLERALDHLLKGHYIRIFDAPRQSKKVASAAASTSAPSIDDFDFSTIGTFQESLLQLTMSAFENAVEAQKLAAAQAADNGSKKNVDANIVAKLPKSIIAIDPNIQALAEYTVRLEAEARAKRAARDAALAKADNAQVTRLVPPTKASPSSNTNPNSNRNPTINAQNVATKQVPAHVHQPIRMETELYLGGIRPEEQEEIKRGQVAEKRAQNDHAHASNHAKAEESARKESEINAKHVAEELQRRVAQGRARMEAEKKSATGDAVKKTAAPAQDTAAAAERVAEPNVNAKKLREQEAKEKREALQRKKAAEEEQFREQQARIKAEAKAKLDELNRAEEERLKKARIAAEAKAQKEREAAEQLKLAQEKQARIEAEARAKQEAFARAKAEEERLALEAKQRREAEEKARLEREAAEQLKREQEEQARFAAIAAAKAKEEALARAKAEEERLALEAKQRREAEEKARLEREAAEQLKREQEEQARLAAIAAAKAKEEALARAKAEEERLALEAKQRREAEEKARLEREAAEQLKREQEEQARLAAIAAAKAKEEALARAKAEEERLALEAEQRREAEEKARLEREAAEQLKREQEEQARLVAIAAAKAKEEALARAKAEEERLALEAKQRREAEEKARLEREAAEQLKREQEEQARLAAIAAAKAKDEALARAKAEEERLALEAKQRREAEEKARFEREANELRKAAEKAKRDEEEKQRAAALADAKAKREALVQAKAEQARLAEEERERQRVAKIAETKAKNEALARATEEQEEQERAAQQKAHLEATNKTKQQEKTAEEQNLDEATSRLRVDTAESNLKHKKTYQRALDTYNELERNRKEADQSVLDGIAALAKQEEAERIRSEKERVAKILEEEQQQKEADEIAKCEEDAMLATHAQIEADRLAMQKRAYALAEEEAAAAREWSAVIARGKDFFVNKVINTLIKKLSVLAVASLIVTAIMLHFTPFPSKAMVFENAISKVTKQPSKISGLYFSLFPIPHWRAEGISIGAKQQIQIAQVNMALDLRTVLDDKIRFIRIDAYDPQVSEQALGWLLFPGNAIPTGYSGTLHLERLKIVSPNLSTQLFDGRAEFDAKGNWSKIMLDGAERPLHIELAPTDNGIKMELSADTFALPFGATASMKQFHSTGTLYEDRLDIKDFGGGIFDGVVKGSGSLKWGEQWSLNGEFNAVEINLPSVVPRLFGIGRMKAKGRFNAQSKVANKLLTAPRIDGSFSLGSGEVMGVDVMNAFRNTQQGGRSTFSNMTGSFSYAGNRTQIQVSRMNAGIVSASGWASVDANAALNGRFSIDLLSPSSKEHADVSLGGKLSDPKFGE